jgi:hypothetical protein
MGGEGLRKAQIKGAQRERLFFKQGAEQKLYKFQVAPNQEAVDLHAIP